MTENKKSPRQYWRSGFGMLVVCAALLGLAGCKGEQRFEAKKALDFTLPVGESRATSRRLASNCARAARGLHIGVSRAHSSLRL